ncbi:MAG: coA binding domain protein [Subtercola sp.]|nr:coA binding domain protein [Subtercola sp.]
MTDTATDRRIASMSALFEPQSICIIGASENNSYARSAFCWLNESEDRVPVYLVNSNRSTVYGRLSHRSVSAIDKHIDLAIIAVGTARVVEALQDCEAAGVRAAIVVAAGFSESATDAGQARLDEFEQFVARTSMVIVGPSCLGVLNATKGIAPYSGTYQRMPKPGSIGVVSQSGGGVRAIFEGGTGRGLGFTSLVSSGSEIDLQTVDYLRYLAEDDATKVICLLLEEARNPLEFYQAVRACIGRGKVVIVLKLGRSEAASRMAAAHTGAFTGSDRFFNLLFERLGVVRVASIEEMLDAASLAAQLPRELWPTGTSVGIVSITGGAAEAIADQLDDMGFTVPDLGESTRTQIARYLPTAHHVQNPLELSNQIQIDDADAWGAVVDTFAADPAIDSVIVIELHASSQTPERVASTKAIQQKHGKPVLTTAGSPWIPVVDDEMAARYTQEGLAHFVGPDNVVRALHAVKIAAAPPTLWEPIILDRIDAAAEAIDATDGIDDASAREILARFGLPVPRERVIMTPDEAPAAIEALGEGPLVLKIVSDDIPHRAKLGLVATGVVGSGELGATVSMLTIRAAQKVPDAVVRGVAVQEQVSGFELFVGIDLQSGFAPMLVLGHGGVGVESTHDVVAGLGSFSNDDLHAMLRRLRCYDWLFAEVGEQGINLAVSLVQDLVRVATEDIRNISHLEVNPLMIHASGDRAWCVDCLIVEKKPSAQ